MSKSIVSNIIFKASSPSKSPEELARTPIDRLNEIPEAFRDKTEEEFTIPKFPNLKFVAVVPRERRETLMGQVSKVYDLKLKKATSVVKLVEENEFAIKKINTKEVPTFDR